METKDKIQITALIIICILIVALIVAIVVLVKNIDEIKSDPVQYAIDKEFYNSCSCVDDEIGFVSFNNKMVIENRPG